MKTYTLPKRLAQEAMRQADEELRKEHERGIFSEGDPNHPMYNNGYNYATGKYVSLFGYDQDEFMEKQYK
jgi:hypothetical protein